MSSSKNRINIYLSEDIMCQLRTTAAAKHVTISSYISKLIVRDINENFEYLKEDKKFKKLIEILEKIENNTRK